MNKRIFYANSEHARPDLPWPLRADRWMWQTGDTWAAVFGDWHADWWDGADPEDTSARPALWSRPIAEIPDHGTLSYRDSSGQDVEEPAPSSGRRRDVWFARAIAATELGPLNVDVVLRTAPHPLVIHGIHRDLAAHLKHTLPAALDASGYAMPAGHLIITVTPTRRTHRKLGIDLAIACAVLAAGRQIDGERLATHALHGELDQTGAIGAVAALQDLASAAYRAGACALLAPGQATITRPPFRAAETLAKATGTLERGPLPACCPACASAPELLSGEDLVERRRSAPADAPAHDANCDDEPGWRCANVHCTHYACYLGAPVQ